MLKQKLFGIILILFGVLTLFISNDATAFVFISLVFGLPLLLIKKNWLI